MVTSSGLPWVAKRIREAAQWITEGKDYAPATVVRMLRESRGNMQEFWYAWSELLDVACDKFDWSQPVVMDSDDREQYASANDFYRREVEPFLGPLERLQQVAGRYRSGEITHDEGKEQITKTQAIRQRRASQPAETQQQTATAVGCDKGFVSKVVRGLTEKSHSEQKVNCPDWLTNPNQQAAFRKLPADERARLEALPADQRRGSVRQAAIAVGIVKVPGVLDQLRKIWAKATDADRRTFMEEIKDGR